ncbi:MAG: GNAT family N-acetyltransferase [Nocardioidaceae bacterium]|nr:GNAT family N-acetyltransferase [Nocardioidaceae bacterium]
MAIALARLTPGDWLRLRQVRLAALADAPEAFGSTLARERDLQESDWRARLEPWHGPKLLATEDDTIAGMVGSFTDPAHDDVVHLVSMWVAPAYRGSGVAQLLLDGFVEDARDEGRHAVRLTVVETNQPARRLYRRNGFVETGETEPYPNREGVREIVMVLQLGGR